MMKTKLFIFSLFLGLMYMACEDSITKVGMGIQPDEDKINVFDTIINISATTVKIDSIYAKSVNGYLGEFYDPTYGGIKSGYICQFYAPEKNAFQDSLVTGKMDSVLLKVSYQSWIGDSLTPMEATVFPVVNALDEHYYTNMDPAKYCDLTHPLGKQGYTARNRNLSDSVFNYIYNNRSNGYTFDLSIKLPTSLGQKLYDEYKKPSPNAYSSLQEFVKFFPGIYLTTTYGTGNLLAVSFTDVYVYYNRYKTTKDVSGNDSVYIASVASAFTLTKEVIQLNSFKNSHDADLLKPSDDKTYLKTPAGVFTKVVIPISKIAKSIGNKKFSSVKLSFNAYPKEDKMYALDFPGVPNTSTTQANKLLLISPDSVKTFFEEQRPADSHTTFTTTFNSTTYSYSFNNIANLIQNAIDKDPNKDLELLLIPVVTQYYSPSTNTVVDYSTSHYLRPSAVTLKKGGDNLKIQIVATNLTSGK